MKSQQHFQDHYDVVIVGAGPSGIFSAYETKKINPSASKNGVCMGRILTNTW